MSANMTCTELTELLLDYLEESLEDARRALCDTHMRGCPACGCLFETYRLTVRVARALPKATPLPAAFEARLRAAFGAHFPPADTPPGPAKG